MDRNPILGLSLCAGIGGLDLGLELALGPAYRTACFVERERFPQSILERRFPGVPIWDDLTTFDGEAWRGVDVVHGGFPCQPFSAVGPRRGVRDSRYLWPEFARIIDECRPEVVFLENTRQGAYVDARPDLRAMGYSIEGDAFCAAEVGAGHIRWRWFVLAHTDGAILRLQPRRCSGALGKEAPKPIGPSWWSSEPGVGRVVHGLPGRVDRQRALGNAVVPLVAAHAFRVLAARAIARNGRVAA